MWRSGSWHAFDATATREEMGAGLPLLRPCCPACPHTRDEAAELQFHLCPVQEGPGRDGAVDWANLSDSRRGTALLQHLWHRPILIEPLSRDRFDLRFAPDESEGAVAF